MRAAALVLIVCAMAMLDVTDARQLSQVDEDLANSVFSAIERGRAGETAAQPPAAGELS